MRAVELFAGGGGAALGLHRAGIHHAALVEWDHDACDTLRAAIDAGLIEADEVVEGDVREVDWSRFADVGLLWSSFPCQGWSTAGKRLGAKDPRNGWPWTVDVIDALRPIWFVGENVPGLLMHSAEGHPNPDDCPACYEATVILPQLRERFAWVGRWEIDAADHGTPQRRNRVFWLAGPCPVVPPTPTHADPEALKQAALFVRRRPWVTVREALGINVVDDEQRNGCRPHPAGIARAVGGKGNAMVVQREDPSRGWEGDYTDEPSPALRGGRPGGGVSLLDRPSPAVVATEYKGSPDSYRPHEPPKMQKASDALWRATGRRRLTTDECAALFDMPPEWPWRGTKTTIYRQIGNMCAWRVIHAIGMSIRRAHATAVQEDHDQRQPNAASPLRDGVPSWGTDP